MKVTVTILDERLNVKVSTSKIEVPVYHKVTNGGTEQIQSDFDQTDETAVDFIKNKPTIPSNAAQITVSDPVTPDFTAVALNDNLQQVTNKVAGLQNNLVHEVTFEEDITLFEITGLDLTDCEVIVTGIVSSSHNSGELFVNDIKTETYWNSVTNSFFECFLIYSGGIVDGNFTGRFSLRKANNRLVYEHIFGSTSPTTGNARTTVQTGYVPLTGNINSIEINGARWKAGTTLKIYRL